MKKCFILEPLCHGNGGWYGVKTLKVCTSLKEALKFKPDTNEHPSPYGGHTINHPRICRTVDINNPVYKWDFDTRTWNKLTPKKGEK